MNIGELIVELIVEHTGEWTKQVLRCVDGRNDTEFQTAVLRGSNVLFEIQNFLFTK
jgi:hypothetical protein